MFKISLLHFILLGLILHAEVYESAEDSASSRWHRVSYKVFGNIRNIYDKEKKSRVIKFDGESTKSTYLLRLDKPIKQTTVLHWEMKYGEDFVIIVDCETTKGKRYFIYTSGEGNSNLIFGLGRESTKNKWKKYSRNLLNDLRTFEIENRILKINNFVIKGSGYIDNIELTEQKILKSQPIKKSIKIVKGDKIPIIRLIGKTPMHLKVGEDYIEPSAEAKDIDGKDLSIDISHNINIFKDGEYIVIYIATNRLGNIAVDKRHIIVGTGNPKKESYKPKKETKKPKKHEQKRTEISKEDEFNTEALEGVDEKTREILMWDRKIRKIDGYEMKNEVPVDGLVDIGEMDEVRKILEEEKKAEKKAERPLRPGL